MPDIKELRLKLAFEKNEIFDCVLSYLSESINAEVDRAVSYSIDEAKRAHACGRAEALKDFQDLLMSEQQKALQERFGVKNNA